jgi:hypothetical protein
MLHIEDAPLHWNKYNMGIVTVDHVIGGVGKQRVVGILIDVGSGEAGLADGETDKALSSVKALALHCIKRKSLRLQEESGIRGNHYLPTDTHFFEHLLGASLPDGYHTGLIQRLTNHALIYRIAQGPRPYCISHYRNAFFMSEHDLSEILLSLSVEQDTATPEKK